MGFAFPVYCNHSVHSMQGGFSTPLAGLATSLARGTHQSGGWSRFPWLLGMAGLALVTSRTAAQRGHGLAVKTMFRFNRVLLTRMNAAAGQSNGKSCLTSLGDIKQRRWWPRGGRCHSVKNVKPVVVYCLLIRPPKRSSPQERFLTRAISEQFSKTSR